MVDAIDRMSNKALLIACDIHPINNLAPLTYLKDKLGERVPNQKGDLLVIRANFTIKRGDFNIMPGQFEDKVSDTIEITLSLAGASPK